MKAWLLLVLAFVAFYASPVVAEEEDDILIEEDDDYDDDLDAHEITTHVLFPENDPKNLPIGEEITVLVDFSNEGQDVFNVTRIAGFLHSPFDLSYYIQNFTVKDVAGVVGPGAQVSLEYKITPDQKLEELEYWLSGFVEYTIEGSDEPFRLTFVNGTTDLAHVRTTISDIVTVLSYVGILGVLALGGYFLLNSAAGKSGAGKPKKKAAATAGPTAAEVEESWEVEEVYKPKAQSSKVARRSKRSKK